MTPNLMLVVLTLEANFARKIQGKYYATWLSKARLIFDAIA